MSEQTAGFGPGSWLPRSVQLAWRQEAINDAAEERQRAADLAERCEQRRSADLTAVVAAAEARGEPLDPIAVATGRVTGRSLNDVLVHARMQSDAEDARAEAEERRKRGERLNLVGALEDPATRSVPATSTAARAIGKTSEAFRAATAARREAGRAQARLERQVPSVYRPYRRRGQ